MILKKDLFLLFLSLLFSIAALAQPDGGGDPGPGPPVPLGGVEILLLAGAGLGLKRFFFGKKEGEK